MTTVRRQSIKMKLLANVTGTCVWSVATPFVAAAAAGASVGNNVTTPPKTVEQSLDVVHSVD